MKVIRIITGRDPRIMDDLRRQIVVYFLTNSNCSVVAAWIMV